MQILVRHIHRDQKGQEELDEQILENAVVSVGHGSDQIIQLLDPAVARRHLELKARSDGQFTFRTVGGTIISLDGVSLKQGVLKLGKSLVLGKQTITVVSPAGGFAAVLEVTTIEQDQSLGSTTHFRVDLSQVGLSMRRPAWLLLIAVLFIFLVIPLAGYFWSDLGYQLRQSAFLPSDQLWLSGPLADVHHSPEIGNNCQTCHMKLFQRTPDVACLDCHAEVAGHVNPQNVKVARLDSTRCASCHKEHGEPASLVRDESGLCLDCHRNPERHATALAANTLPDPVAGFSSATHPEFRLALLRPVNEGEQWQIERLLHSSDAARETSQLKFPHDLHLDPDKVQSLSTGQALECASCHALSEDREHFEPVTMEGACQSCHALSFDDDFPGRQLPHGDVEAALLALEEHYIRKHADPELSGDGGQRGRRRPGQAESTTRCLGTVLDCGRQSAAREAVSQFSRSGCVTCHEVSEEQSRPFLERWQVRPVKLADDWYPFSQFNHSVHLTRSRDQLGDAIACASCHAAQASDSSQDVLIPGIETCLDCHRDDPVQRTRTVALSCQGCHDFHLSFHAAMRSPHSGVDRQANQNPTYSDRGYANE